jgi:hypothetical protein
MLECLVTLWEWAKHYDRVLGLTVPCDGTSVILCYRSTMNRILEGKNGGFWDVAPSGFYKNRRFGGT